MDKCFGGGFMYVELCKNNGTDYLRLVSSRRVIDKNGRKTARKKTELNIGPLSRYDDGKPGYVERLKNSFKEGHPLIPALLPFVSKQKSPEKYTVTFVEDSPDCIAHPKIASHFLLDKVFQALKYEGVSLYSIGWKTSAQRKQTATEIIYMCLIFIYK